MPPDRIRKNNNTVSIKGSSAAWEISFYIPIFNNKPSQPEGHKKGHCGCDKV